MASYIYYDQENEGEIIIDPELSDYMEQDFYKVPFESQKTHITDPESYELIEGSGDSVLMICILQPIVENGKSIAVVGVDYYMASIIEMVSQYDVMENAKGFVSLALSDGTIIASRNEDFIGKNFSDLIVSNKYKNILKEILSIQEGSSVVRIKSPKGENIVSGISAVQIGNSGTSYIVIASIPESELGKSGNQSIIIGIIVSLVIFALGTALLSFLIKVSILKPISKQISMLSNTTNELSTMNGELSVSSHSLAKSSSELTQAVSLCVSSIGKVSELSDRNIKNVEKGKSASDEALKITENGVLQTKEISDSLDDLEKGSIEIRKVMDIVDNIAFQTNLLALNAAVEAARAGEHGKGFAVVAGEVRGLSKRSTDATKKTAEIVSKNITMINENAVNGKKVGDTLSEVNKQTENVAKMLSEIADSESKQKQSILRINDAMKQLEDGANRTATESSRCRDFAGNLSDEAKNLFEVAKNLDLLIHGCDTFSRSQTMHIPAVN
jgi:methyl-accepting chemotaxis protein